MKSSRLLIPVLLGAAVCAIAMDRGHSPGQQYTSDFGLAAPFSTLPLLIADGGNRYFPLEPGAFQRLEGEDDGEPMQVLRTVLNETRPITFTGNGEEISAVTRIVEEREWVDGELSEVTLNYYACCPDTRNVYFFGEDVTLYEDGKVIGQQGTWLAGKEGAMPGLAMPGTFLLGSRYHLEVAPGVAMDRAENVAMGVTIDTPAGQFADCVIVFETDPLDPEEEVLKVYAAGVGPIADGDLELIEYGYR